MYAKDKAVILDRREMLRVKLKSLAAEAKIIRREEKRTFGVIRDELWKHRITVVRSEARCTHLAYGFIKGHTLEQMEQKSDTPPDWGKVRAMLKKYGPIGMLEPEVMRQAA
jgi:hypothetical protein